MLSNYVTLTAFSVMGGLKRVLDMMVLLGFVLQKVQRHGVRPAWVSLATSDVDNPFPACIQYSMQRVGCACDFVASLSRLDSTRKTEFR